MDFNDWYRNKYDDEFEEPMDLEDSKSEELELIKEIFFSKEENNADSSLSAEHLVESILQFADMANKEKKAPIKLSPEDVLKQQLEDTIRNCENFLIEREIAGVVKFSKKRVIYPNDLVHLRRDEYQKVLKVMQEGNATLDLTKEPVHYKAACVIIEDAMPSTFNLSLTAKFSGIFQHPSEISKGKGTAKRTKRNDRLGMYYLRNYDKGKTRLDRLSALFASVYYQSDTGRYTLDALLRKIRFQNIISPVEELVESQHWKAQLTRGYSHLTGIGKPQNDIMAFSQFKASAKQNVGKSQLTVGMCYFFGIGVEKDEKRGFHWVEHSALGGHISGIYELAFCYLYGRGTEQDYDKMFQTLEPLVETESKLACFICSLCYSFGIAVAQDSDKGLALSKLGNDFLLENLGSPLKDALMEMLDSV